MIDIRKTARLCLPALALLLVALTALAGVRLQRVVYPRKYELSVTESCEQFGVDENLVYAIIKTESGFSEDACSDAGARGLMQIMPDTFKWLQSKLPADKRLSADELYKPETNIRYGVFFVSILLEEFGDERLAVAAYHAGRGRVNSWLSDREISSSGSTIENIPSKNTGHYVRKVMNYHRAYDRVYGEN